MSKFAVIFPGQGSQSVSMLDSYSNIDAFNSVIDESSEVLKYDIKEVIKDEVKLNNTIYTQPIIVAVSMGIWKTWSSKISTKPDFAAGHSLGEYSALLASGAITLNDCLNIVKERATMMVDAMNGRESAMAAVIGLKSSKIEDICKEISSPKNIIEAVNYNSALQTVVAGDLSAVNQSLDMLKKAGAKLVKRLPVSVASHTSIMEKCSEKLNKLLINIKLSTPNFPVIHNIDASSKNTSDDIIKSLCKQVHSPVLWSKTINALTDLGVNKLVEIGPGNVLTGLNKRINKDIEAINISDFNMISEVDIK